MHSSPLIVSRVSVNSYFDRVVDVFLADCQARNLSPRTIQHRDWAIRRFRSSLPG